MRTIEELVIKKREAIRYRLAGRSLSETRLLTGLSVPTIIKAVESFQRQGWQGVESKKRGRKATVKKREKGSEFFLLQRTST